VSFLCAGPPVAERSPRTAGVRVLVGSVAVWGAGAGLEVVGGGMVGSKVVVDGVVMGADSKGAWEGESSALGAYREALRPLFTPPRPPLCLLSCPSFRTSL